MGTAAEEKYFVYATKDAPAKGPFGRAQIEQSLSKGLIKPTAFIRLESAPDGELRQAKELTEEKELARAKVISAFAQQDAENDARRERSGSNGQMLFGLLLLLIGLGLTAATCSAAGEGGGRYVVFTGMIVGGIAQMIRGMSRR